MAFATWDSLFTVQAATTTVVLFILLRVFQLIVEDRKIRKLGHHAHKRSSWLPLGVFYLSVNCIAFPEKDR